MNGVAANTDEYLKDLPAWQAKNLKQFRDLVHITVPSVTEEIKWGVPVFVYKTKLLFAMASFAKHTKYNFILNGALIADPDGLFNNGLESKKSRAIDLQENQQIDSGALKDLIKRAADALN